jgi:hypothetical protein
VAVARLFLAAAVREVGMDDETIDDLKIAVSEAVTFALDGSAGDGRIRLTITPEPDALTFEVARLVGDAVGGIDASLDGGVRLAIITSLFPNAVADAGSVRFSIPIAPGDMR